MCNGDSEVGKRVSYLLLTCTTQTMFQILKTKQEIKQPMYNETMSGLSFDDMQRHISQQIFKQLKNTPELIGMVDTLVSDHFMGEIDYFNTNMKPLGPTQYKKVLQFWQDNKMDDVFYGVGVDYFMDGSAFPWYDSAKFNLSLKQKEQMLSYDQTYGTFLTKVARDQIEYELEKPRKVSYLAASSTEIIHDETGIVGYKQDTGGKQKVWSPDQVEHLKLMEFNGEVRSYSGLKALVKEIAIMYMIKENLIAKLNNGGSPDTIIYLKNANSTFTRSKFERLRTALESFSHLRKSHGNMPIEAEVGAIPLSESLKDMEYRELAMFAISEFCLATGMPTSRVPFMMTGSGGTTNKGEMSGLGEDSYQKKINARRRKWENCWNKIFSKAGFNIKFRRGNLQDDIRETQAATQRASYVTEIQNQLFRRSKQLTEDAMLQLLSGTKNHLTSEDVEKADTTMMNPMGTGNNIHNDTANRNSELKGRVSQDRMASKMRTAKNNGVNA